MTTSAMFSCTAAPTMASATRQMRDLRAMAAAELAASRHRDSLRRRRGPE